MHARRISRCLWVAAAMLFLIASSGAHARSRVVSSQQSPPQDSEDRLLLLYNTRDYFSEFNLAS